MMIDISLSCCLISRCVCVCKPLTQRLHSV